MKISEVADYAIETIVEKIRQADDISHPTGKGSLFDFRDNYPSLDNGEVVFPLNSFSKDGRQEAILVKFSKFIM